MFQITARCPLRRPLNTRPRPARLGFRRKAQKGGRNQALLWPLQVPPLTPSTKQRFNDVLKTTYASWDNHSERLAIPKDPRVWSREHIGHWLKWAIREFSFSEPNLSQFAMQFQVGIW